MKKTLIQAICATTLALAFTASHAQDAAQATPAATDNGVQWKSYPTAQPGWRASVAYVDAFINDFGAYQDTLVAPCGDSGEVAYVSGFGAPFAGG